MPPPAKETLNGAFALKSGSVLAARCARARLLVVLEELVTGAAQCRGGRQMDRMLVKSCRSASDHGRATQLFQLRYPSFAAVDGFSAERYSQGSEGPSEQWARVVKFGC